MPAKVARLAPKVRGFFEQLPVLFAQSKRSWERDYNGLIYSIERPLTRANVADVVAWADGGKLPSLGLREVDALNKVLLPVRWPDVRSLARLKGIEGMTLPRATALLHLHNPSFPPFTQGAVEGLALLGKRLRRPERVGLEEVRAYRRHMDAIAELKEGIPFRFVPESHYFHVWVLECALAELARRGNGHGARR